MAEIVNLRTARKRKAREDDRRIAEQNRVRHGRSKDERRAAEAERDRASAAHDAHRRDRPSENGGTGDGGR